MRRMSLVWPLAFSSVFLIAVVAQSAEKPQILSTSSRRVIPGVLLDVNDSVSLDGTATTASLLQDLAARFVQGGRSQSAGLRAAHLMRLPPNEQESPGGGAAIVMVVTVPAGLQDGPADLIVSYRKSESDPRQVEISLRPPPPAFAFMSVSLDGRMPDPKTIQRPPLEFVRGRKAEARIYPIVEPDTDNAVLCTFRQAG